MILSTSTSSFKFITLIRKQSDELTRSFVLSRKHGNLRLSVKDEICLFLLLSPDVMVLDFSLSSIERSKLKVLYI